jgi:hypothetical protein
MLAYQNRCILNDLDRRAPVAMPFRCPFRWDQDVALPEASQGLLPNEKELTTNRCDGLFVFQVGATSRVLSRAIDAWRARLGPIRAPMPVRTESCLLATTSRLTSRQVYD